MVESSESDCEQQMQEIMALFYADEPLKAYKMLQILQNSHAANEKVRKFAETEEMILLKNDYEILTSF
jgi:hypothetical protein